MSNPTPTPATGEIPAARALPLASLVAAAPGSVVSRTLHRREHGTLTLFSFDEGQGLSEHSAPYDAYVLVLEGQAALTIGGEPVTARTGEVVRMPANVPHSLHAAQPFKMLLMMIRE